MTEFECILWLVIQKAAYSVDLFTYLAIFRLENGEFAVNWELGEEKGSQEFKEPEKAVQKFLDMRHQLKLGFDYDGFVFRKDH